MLGMQEEAVQAASPAPERIILGSRVTLEALDEPDEWEVVIVSRDQADPTRDWISDECPIGEALLGRRAGDTIRVEVPLGTVEYRVISVCRSSHGVLGGRPGQPQLPARSYWDEP